MSDSRKEPETGPEQGGVGRGGAGSGAAGPDGAEGGAPSRRTTGPGRAPTEAGPGRAPTGERPDAAPGRPTTWLGRAEVPRREAPEVRYAAPEWETGPEQRQYRPWWLPILVGTVALLFGLLSIAVWVVAESRRTGPAPGLPSPGPTSEVPRTEPPATTAPSVGVPSTGPTTATGIPMPPLVGLHEATAREMLDELGLSYRLRFQTAPQRPGTVVETQPSAGTLLGPGDLVTLVIAEEPTGTPVDSGGLSQPPTPIG